jgi:hypothetical protein
MDTNGDQTMEYDNEAFKGPQETNINIEGSKTKITLDDVATLKVSLLEYLERVNSAEVEDRDYLIRITAGAPASIDTEGLVRIGGWLLQSRDRGMCLTYRMPSGGDVIKGYLAEIKRENKVWRVVALRAERIHRRR